MSSEQLAPRISGGLLAPTIGPADRSFAPPRRSAPLSLERRLLTNAAALASHELKRAHRDAGESLAEGFAQLVDAITLSLAGETPRVGRWKAPVPPSVMLSTLNDAVLEITEDEEEVLSATSVVKVLRAIKQVQQVFAADPTQAFADSLSGARGLEMVVEIAHDMRSPLTSILFLVETLRSSRSGNINAAQERQLGLVYGAAFGLSAMTSDVMELVRGGERLLDANPIPFSLVETIESVRDIVRPIAEEKQLELRTAVPERDARVGYPAALSRVLLNLTTNALKFTHEGWVEVSARQKSHTRVEFEVRDTGPGVPSHVQTTIFSPFRQNPYARGPVFSSAGLGLSICRKLVEAMGSELFVESAPGQGTRFRFELELPIASKM